MKGIILILTLLTFSISVRGQKFTIDDIPLKWEDFKVVDGYKPYTAYLYTRIPCKWEIKKEGDSSHIIFRTEVIVDHNESWVRRDFIDTGSLEYKLILLNHEKGHYLIALKYHRKLQQVLTIHKYSSNPKKEINELHRTILKNLSEENRLYDEETNHMFNTVKQAEWLEKLIQEVNLLYAEDERILLKSEFKVASN